MEEVLKKVFDRGVLAVIGVLILFVVIFEYVVFPGLTASDTYINILSFIIGVMSVLFIYHFIQWGDLINFIVGKKEVAPIVEKVLDETPKKEVVKKKPTSKAKIKKIVIESSQVSDVEFVKKPTKKKRKNKKATETESVSTRKPKQ